METESQSVELKAAKAAEFRARMVEANAKRLAAGIVVERLDPLERARRHPNSLKMAIAAKCWDCQGGDHDPHPRWRIGNCVSPDCPLYLHRPHQKTFGQATPASLRMGQGDSDAG